MTTRFTPVLAGVCLSLCAFSSYAQDEDELLWTFGDEDFVSIATGRKQSISKAPAVASVITAAQIKNIGARDIDEALETIAGLHVSHRSGGYNPVYVIRGIHSDFNPQVLLLINGIPINNVFGGDRSQVWGGMPVENISRIEVIRGPGSAVYGADAFAGTINIVTKVASEIDGLEVGASGGSFDTYRTWALYGKETEDWALSASLQTLKTDGHDETIETDFASLVGLPSFAPNGVNLERENIDARIDFAVKKLRFRAGYQSRNDIGLGVGGAQSLDPTTGSQGTRINADLTYHDTEFADNWEVKTTLSYYDVTTKVDLVLFPPGAFGIFPDGIIGNPDVYERHYRWNNSAFYTGFDKHDIRIGFGYHFLDQYKIKEAKNFRANTNPLIPIPFLPLPGGMQLVTGADLFNQEEDREVSYIFIQDEWSLAKDWSLTLGLRHDHYSDFGDTTNPRAALVWETAHNLTTKLLYGQAFRAPSFAEQFNQANPVAIGNANLDPEQIETFELAFTYIPVDDLKIGFNLFYYDFEDIIRFTPVAQNTGNQTGKGLELEMDWKISKEFTIKANYALQNSEDEAVGTDAPNAPEQQLYLNMDYSFTQQWSINAQLNMVADRNRQAGDTRSDIDDYTTLDLTLRSEKLFDGVDLLISVHNVTDEEVLEPSLFDPLTGIVAIPSDLPQAGRSYMLEIRKTWQ